MKAELALIVLGVCFIVIIIIIVIIHIRELKQQRF